MPDPVRCPDCGERLADGVDDDGIWVEGRHLRFRRTTDHLACASCGGVWPVADFAPRVETPEDLLRALTYEVPGTLRDDETEAVPDPSDPDAAAGPA